MSNHILCNKYWSMNLSIVNTEGVTDKFWDNRT